MTWVIPHQRGTRIRVKVTPGAKETHITGVKADRLLIHVKGQPIKGEVNRELIKFIADKIRKNQDQITLTAGRRTRAKTLHVNDTDDTRIRKILSRTL